MSDIDQTSDDRITGAQVIDGVLVLRRYDGSRLEVSTGGGFSEQPFLDWAVSKEDLDPSSEEALPTNYATLYDSLGNILQDVLTEDITSDGLAVGDDYLLQRGGADGLYFRTPGVYLANVGASPTPIADGDSTLKVIYSSSFRGAIYSITLPAGDPPSFSGQLVIVVGQSDIAINTDEEPWAPDDVFLNGSSLTIDGLHTSATAQDVSGEIYITKIS